MTSSGATLDTQCINTIRTLSMDAIQKANSGHPGAPMGLAPAAYTLWTRVMRHNPKNPSWPDRDRFVLSGGHASMLLYSLLHLSGYGVSMDDLKAFRQMGSKTPGHPEFAHTPGVETTTGPLGQGLANAVGMAMAERHMAAVFNTSGISIVDHFTYVMCGDGDLMEGISQEALSMAGHLKLGRLICLYDDNRISIEGPTAITFTEDTEKRFDACGWHVQTVADGNDVNAIEAALNAAKAETEKPSLIILKTEIAYGSPGKQGSADAHGAPLGEAEIVRTKENLGCPPDAFFVPDAVKAHFAGLIPAGAALEAEWQSRYDTFAKQDPQKAEQWVNGLAMFLPSGWDRGLPDFSGDDAIATRAASGKVLNALARNIPNLIGGSADLAPSNKTFINGEAEFQAADYAGRNIRFGVREHAMGAIMSGMLLHGGLRPYGGTFLVFADYMRPAIRVASLMKLPLIYVFTHDSVAVGEDGPTHQPVEHLAALRLIPNLNVIRPADGPETVQAWKEALKRTDGPTALILSRQKLPVLDRSERVNGHDLPMGAYILADSKAEKPELILMASGSEVQLAMAARKKLATEGIDARVISIPCWELYQDAPPHFQERLFPESVTARIAIEAGSAMGWERFVGANGVSISIDRFGTSAPGGQVLETFGYTVENVVKTARKLLGK